MRAGRQLRRQVRSEREPRPRCAVCLYDERMRNRPTTTAISVIDGIATCYDHLGFVGSGDRLSEVLLFMHHERRRQS